MERFYAAFGLDELGGDARGFSRVDVRRLEQLYDGQIKGPRGRPEQPPRASSFIAVCEPDDTTRGTAVFLWAALNAHLSNDEQALDDSP